MSIIRLNNVSKFYHNKTTISSGFTKLNLELNMGEFVVITGESGSGKTTLLNVISGLDSYEEGEMYINGEETSHYNEIDYENYRRKYIGNIFQNFNLVNSYTVYQNVELVLLLNGHKKKEIRSKILDILKTVGLSKYKNTKASKLSGGQKQRVAIARALAKDTPIIIADEPTGNLDVQSAKSIMKLLKEISINKLVIIVTHNYEQVEEYATRKISMNDGKIIEDKNIEKVKTINPDIIKYKDLTFGNKILIGIRNSFNIKTKFLLLLLVYFFITLFLFSEYSSLRKQAYDESVLGYNYYFSKLDSNRVILNKHDKSAITREDLNKLDTIKNITNIDVNDTLLDIPLSIYNDDVYLYGNISHISEIDKIDIGKMPIEDNEIIVAGAKDTYYFDIESNDLLNQKLTLQDDYTGSLISEVKIAGIKYIDDANAYDNLKIYVTDAMLEKVRMSINIKNNNIIMVIDNNKFIQNEYRMYYDIMPNKYVKDGEAYGFQEMNNYCTYYNCTNKNIKLSVDNIYYSDTKEFKIKKILTNKNFKSSTGLSKIEDYSNILFISENDYKNLFDKGIYQISVFIDDAKSANETITEIENLGYDTYYMKENLYNASNDLMGLVNIIRKVVFIIATVVLFFISYFIIKIILKSRNVYFSTLRILGATKKVSKQLLNIELFVDSNIAYILFLILIGMAKIEIIPSEYIKDLVTYFNINDYIAIYIILIILSMLISNRYSRKLFNNSALKTYREEV